MSRFRFEIGCTVMRLYNGRRSLYLSLTIGQSHWFISRWDTARVDPKPANRDLWRGPEMTWYCGAQRFAS